MLSYEEYLNMGGDVEEEDFPLFLTHAKMKIDFVTMGRFSNYSPAKEELLKCQLLLFKVINLLTEQSEFKMRGVTSYSNGIESISYYDPYTDDAVNKKIKNMCVEHLQGTGLLYRGVR